MAHREGIREFLKDVEVHGRVIDWGSGTKPIKNYLKENNATFFSVDILDHVGADMVTNIERGMPKFGEYDFAFCLEVIEHTWNAPQVIKNIYNNLKKGGTLYLSQPFMYEVHKEDDVHRYTYHGLKRLLEEGGFTIKRLKPTGATVDNAWGYVLEAVK